LGSKSTSRAFPGFDKLFYLGESGSSRAFRGDVPVETNAVALTRAELQPALPLSVDWAMGSAKPGEVIWTTMGTMVIVAEPVVQLLRAKGFTGWSLYPAAIRDKQGQPVPGYSGLAFTGRCGDIDKARSVQVPRIRPAGIFPAWKGLFFDPTSWDGSDLFMPGGPVGWKLVVEEVKRAFEQARIRNVEFTPLDQLEVDWPR
jgi:hypothetical protein